MGGFRIEGLDKFRRNIERVADEERWRMMKAINAIGDVALHGAVEHAPIDEGHLGASIEKSIQVTPDAVHAVIRVPLNAPAADYATAMHEDQYTPGEKSQAKAAKNGLPVGRKYIVNGIKHAKPKIKRIAKEVL